MNNVGILGYGVYIPKYRIKVSEIAPVWGKEPLEVENSLGTVEKSVASFDEDAVTLGFEAGVSAVKNAQIDIFHIDVCFVGSESHPYAVNPTSTIVAEFLGLKNNYLAADLQFACKAATSGMIAVSGLILGDKARIGLVIGSDTAQAKVHDILEYTAASGACAIILGKSNGREIANLIDFSSFSSDTPDFWRRDGIRFPSHGGRFTGKPAYFTHVESAANRLLAKTKMEPSDFDYCVFHMPNGKFPRQVAKRLGFSQTQIAPSLVVDQIGNPYSASSLIGLAAVLDIARPKSRIFMVSYGSGAGSDAFIFETTENIGRRKKMKETVEGFLSDKEYVSYIKYLKNTKKI